MRERSRDQDELAMFYIPGEANHPRQFSSRSEPIILDNVLEPCHPAKYCSRLRSDFHG